MAVLTPQQAGVVIYPSWFVPNPNVHYGEIDMYVTPVTYPRFATRWADLQLSNGWDGTNFGKRDRSPQAGYLAGQIPFQPGQTRQFGQNLADFPMQGMSYQQWQLHVQTTAGAQPQYAGGPGQIIGGVVNNGSGA